MALVMKESQAVIQPKSKIKFEGRVEEIIARVAAKRETDLIRFRTCVADCRASR